MTPEKYVHWTEEKTAFQYFITDEFIDALSEHLESLDLTRKQFAERLGVTEGRVSQIFNNPGNITLSKVVEWSRAIGLKVSIVTYNDDDPENQFGPVVSEVFSKLWELHDKPRNYKFLNKVIKNCSQKKI